MGLPWGGRESACDAQPLISSVIFKKLLLYLSFIGFPLKEKQNQMQKQNKTKQKKKKKKKKEN